MELLTKELIQELLAADQAPCLSLYMSTDRTHPENLKNPVKFKNLVSEMEKSLLQKYSANDVQVDDLLDDMGELVMKMGGQVMVLPTDKMPSETGLAAIFRY